jgi:hypothetical protein
MQLLAVAAEYLLRFPGTDFPSAKNNIVHLHSWANPLFQNADVHLRFRVAHQLFIHNG